MNNTDSNNKQFAGPPCSAIETLADIIPALERASGLKADTFRSLARPGGLSGDEVAALWMARAILEEHNVKVSDPAH